MFGFNLKKGIVLLFVLVFMAACAKDAPQGDFSTDSQGEQTRWSGGNHRKITNTCLKDLKTKLGWSNLSDNRISTITAASDDPDDYQKGVDEWGYSQNWSHAYLLNKNDNWRWGDADDDYHDNLDGGGEGYRGKSAKYKYRNSTQKSGDKYVGYAIHYIQDTSLIVHASWPGLDPRDSDLVRKHLRFEKWVANNLTKGKDLLKYARSDRRYYSVTDPKAAIRAAAKKASYYNSLGNALWKAYRDSGYPVDSGKGNSALVYNTRKMIRNACRYTRGTVKYALDKYKQWNNKY
jgi:hypothetical protein